MAENGANGSAVAPTVPAKPTGTMTDAQDPNTFILVIHVKDKAGHDVDGVTVQVWKETWGKDVPFDYVEETEKGQAVFTIVRDKGSVSPPKVHVEAFKGDLRGEANLTLTTATVNHTISFATGAGGRSVKLTVKVTDSQGKELSGVHVNVYYEHNRGSRLVATPPDYQDETNPDGIARFNDIFVKTGESLDFSTQDFDHRSPDAVKLFHLLRAKSVSRFGGRQEYETGSRTRAGTAVARDQRNAVRVQIYGRSATDLCAVPPRHFYCRADRSRLCAHDRAGLGVALAEPDLAVGVAPPDEEEKAITLSGAVLRRLVGRYVFYQSSDPALKEARVTLTGDALAITLAETTYHLIAIGNGTAFDSDNSRTTEYRFKTALRSGIKIGFLMKGERVESLFYTQEQTEPMLLAVAAPKP